MSDNQGGVFLSYRREASRYLARSIFLDLRANGWDVFYDVESINAGNFETIIQNQLRARAHFLILITPGTLERCADPNDWVRREIELAFELGRNIVPLLAGGMTFNDETRRLLPGRLADLVRVQALEVPPEDMYFDAAMTLLRTRFLRQPVVGTLQPAPVNEQLEVERVLSTNATKPAPTANELAAEQALRRGLARNDNSDAEIADYDEALRLHPTYDDAFNNRGAVYSSRGDFDRAIADLNAALRLNPKHINALYNRANAYYNRREYRLALQDYSAVLQINGSHVNALYNRGLTWENLGELRLAIADFEQYLALGGGERDGDRASVEQRIARLRRIGSKI